MTEPVPGILPRRIVNEGVGEVLGGFADLIDEVVNFGTHVMMWVAERPPLEGDAAAPMLLSIRHALEVLDSISPLIRQGSADPAKIPLRALIETVFGIKYLLQDDLERRSMCFMVWHAHHRRNLYENFDSRTERGKQFQAVIAADRVAKEMNLSGIPDLTPAIENINRLLARSEYEEAEREYQRLRRSGRRNPSWYEFFGGPRTVEQLARAVGMPAVYEVIYRAYSGQTHGTDIIHGKISSGGPGESRIVQIRWPEEAQHVTSLSVAMGHELLSAVVGACRPEKKDEVRTWYIRVIREPYLRVAGEPILDVVR